MFSDLKIETLENGKVTIMKINQEVTEKILDVIQVVHYNSNRGEGGRQTKRSVKDAKGLLM